MSALHFNVRFKPQETAEQPRAGSSATQFTSMTTTFLKYRPAITKPSQTTHPPYLYSRINEVTGHLEYFTNYSSHLAQANQIVTNVGSTPSLAKENCDPTAESNKACFMDMMSRISEVFSMKNLYLAPYIPLKNVDLFHLPEYLWSHRKEVDMSDLISKLAEIDLNEAILLLTFHPYYQKGQVTAALSRSLVALNQNNHFFLTDFYLAILVKEQIIDFTLYEAKLIKKMMLERFNPHSKNLLINLLRFILMSIVKGLKFSDFLTCGLDWKSENDLTFVLSLQNNPEAASPSRFHGNSICQSITHSLYSKKIYYLTAHIKSQLCNQQQEFSLLFKDLLSHYNALGGPAEQLKRELDLTYQHLEVGMII